MHAHGNNALHATLQDVFIQANLHHNIYIVLAFFLWYLGTSVYACVGTIISVSIHPTQPPPTAPHIPWNPHTSHTSPLATNVIQPK